MKPGTPRFVHRRGSSVCGGLLLALAWIAALAALAAGPASAADGERPLHELVRAKAVELTVTDVASYRSAQVKLVNRTDRALVIDPTGTALQPTRPDRGQKGLPQRLALTTPADYRPEHAITLSPGGSWEGWLRSCCMDSGRPAPKTAAPYTCCVEADERITGAMTYWRQHPEVSQGEINSVVWKNTTLEQMVERHNRQRAAAPPAPPPPDPNELENEMALARAQLLASRQMTWAPLTLEHAGDGSREERAARALQQALRPHLGGPDDGDSGIIRPIVVLLTRSGERGAEASRAFRDELLIRRTVFEQLGTVTRVELDVDALPERVARVLDRRWREAPALLLLDHRGRWHATITTGNVERAAIEISRVRAICRELTAGAR